MKLFRNNQPNYPNQVNDYQNEQDQNPHSVCFFLNGISVIHADDYVINRYGAVGDGITLDTKAIQATIDDCSLHG